MIINNTYFIDEIFLPNAKPSVTGDLTAIPANVMSFINTYASEALVKCFGFSLYRAFTNQLDNTKDNGLKDDADVKWDELLNGAEYTDSSGKAVYWPGIRVKNGETYNKSFLAEYVYFHYEKSNDEDRTGVGNVKQNAENASIVSKTPKVIAAWRRFVEQVQGSSCSPQFVSNGIGYGVDWYGSGKKFKSLYEFIEDKNRMDPATYPNFDPTRFVNMNQFGI